MRAVYPSRIFLQVAAFIIVRVNIHQIDLFTKNIFIRSLIILDTDIRLGYIALVSNKLNVRLKTAIIESLQAQQDIAELIPMHNSRLSAIVRGRLSPNEIEKQRLAEVLHRSVDELFGEEVAK